LRAFWLTLFAIGAGAVLVTGWQGGEPWTAAAFVVFFASRVARSIIKRPLFPARESDSEAPARRLHWFLVVTAAGWLLSGALAAIAAFAGEGQEWMYVAPCFLLMGALQVYVIFGRA
jgi:sterol desaturase/sphingolipid hydroxylase (fatty acid hydroxylase superfamily)